MLRILACQFYEYVPCVRARVCVYVYIYVCGQWAYIYYMCVCVCAYMHHTCVCMCIHVCIHVRVCAKEISIHIALFQDFQPGISLEMWSYF